MVSDPKPCKKKLYLSLVVDRSNSVKQHNFLKVIEFLKKFYDLFPVSQQGTRIGLITFNKGVTEHFDFTETNMTRIKHALDGERVRAGTHTVQAMQMAADMFTKAKGMVNPKFARVVVVFTDGRKTEKQPYEPVLQLLEVSRAKSV